MGGNYDRGIIIFTLIMFYALFVFLVNLYGNSTLATDNFQTEQPDLGFVAKAGISASGLDEGNTDVRQFFLSGLRNVPVWLNIFLGALFIFLIIIIISLLKGG